MKYVKYFLIFLVCISLGACSKSSKLKSEAEKQMELTFKEYAKDPSSVKLTNKEIVYSDDSLCIIHVDYAGKNGLGTEINTKYEYVMLSSNDKYYEALQPFSSEDATVYKSQEYFEKHKEGQIYEKLSYASSLYYFAAVFVNTQGREAGKKESKPFSIKVPTGTGSWLIGTFTNEFGEQTNEKYLVLQGSGFFSNSATTNSRLIGAINVKTSGDFGLMLVEYGYNIVKSSDTYDVHIKDVNGDIFNMVMYGDRATGMLTTMSSDDNTTMRHILDENGYVTFSITQRNMYGTPSTYILKFDVTGFEKAKQYCLALRKRAFENEPYFIANKEYLSKISKSHDYKEIEGIYYKVIKDGHGNIPKYSSKVRVMYELKNVYGKIIDTNYKNNPTSMYVNQVIKGFEIAVTHMPVGSVWEVVIPSELGYEDRDVTPDLRPFSVLIFKIELLQIEE